MMDHYSRRILGLTLFEREPTSEAMRVFLGRVIHATKAKPRHLVSDQGPQFSSKGFKRWCRRRQIRPRFGAIGQHGSIAVTERLILSVKECIARLTLEPRRRKAFLRELQCLTLWYNLHRPHTTLGGRTPDEVCHRRRPMNCQPRLEPRARWPRSSSCASPVTLIRGQPGARLKMEVQFAGGHRHLPVVSLMRAA